MDKRTDDCQDIYVDKKLSSHYLFQFPSSGFTYLIHKFYLLRNFEKYTVFILFLIVILNFLYTITFLSLLAKKRNIG